MLFNSWYFLLFFPIVTALYFLFSHPYRWFILLSASCIFYMVYIPKYILILALLILIDYSAALMMEQASPSGKKLCLTLSILSTCSVLLFFKYFNFFNSSLGDLAALLKLSYVPSSLEILLPIGLSFHTFQSLSYVIEVYQGNQKAERNLGIYALYVMFYPQLVAGPIERPQTMIHQFREPKYFDYSRVVEGLLLMAWGLLKKVVVADNLALLVNPVYAHPANYHNTTLLLATLFFSIQIYCDFSGYTDIARGAAKVMGFELSLNFDHPYTAKSLSEFWRRWHISLSSWLRDYIYTPLVLKKRYWGNWGAVYALMLTFIISGLWHGAAWTFIAWGCIHGIGLSCEALTAKFRKKYVQFIPKSFYGLISLVCTFSFVSFSYIFFRAENLSDALYIAHHIIGRIDFGSVTEAWSLAEIKCAIEVILLLQVVEFCQRRITIQEFLNKEWWYRWTAYYSMVITLLTTGQWFTARQFIYFQF